MGIINRLFRRKDAEQRATNSEIRDILRAQLSLTKQTDSGIAVNANVALTMSAVYGCVNIIDSAFCSLPAAAFIGSKKLDRHPIPYLLNIEPNQFMTAATFKDTMQTNLLLYGNCYAMIKRINVFPFHELIPVPSINVKVLIKNDEIKYEIKQSETKSITLGQADVLHIKNFSFDGLVGISPIEKIKQAIGLGLASEKFGNLFFSNGANSGGILKLPAGMTDPDAINSFVEQWQSSNSGLDAAFKVALGIEGMEFLRTTIDPEKAQMLDTRIHQVREVARVYRVPLDKLGDVEASGKGSNIEHQSIAFRSDTIQPWATRWEQEVGRKLLTEKEKAAGAFVRFNLDVLLRSDTKTRYEAHFKAAGAPFMTVNEIRKKEDLQPVKGGDELVTPLNMGAAANLTQTKALPLLIDAEKRIATKEINAIKRALKKHDADPNGEGFASWVDQFFNDDHRNLVASVVDPVAASFDIEINSGYASAHIQRAKADALAIRDSNGDREDLLKKWINERPTKIIKDYLGINKNI